MFNFSSNGYSHSNSWGTFAPSFCPEAKDASIRYYQDARDAQLAVKANQELLEEAEEDLSSAQDAETAAKEVYKADMDAQKAAEQVKAQAWTAYCAGPVGLVVESERTPTGERNTLYAAYLRTEYEAKQVLYSATEDASEAYEQACLAARASYRATRTARESCRTCVSEVVNAENRLATAKYEAKRLGNHAAFFHQAVEATAVNIYWEEGEDGVPVMRVYGGGYLILEIVQPKAVKKPQALLETAVIDVVAEVVLLALPPAGETSGQYAVSIEACNTAMADTLKAGIAVNTTDRTSILDLAIAKSRVATAAVLAVAIASSSTTRTTVLEAAIASSRESTAAVLEAAIAKSRESTAAVLAKYSISI